MNRIKDIKKFNLLTFKNNKGNVLRAYRKNEKKR